MKKRLFVFGLSLMMLLSGCSKEEEIKEDEVLLEDGIFTNLDMDSTYDESKAIDIFKQEDGDGIQYASNSITISKAGIYLLNGQYNGQVIVDAPEQKVQIVLASCTLTHDKEALFIKNAKKVFVTMKPYSYNHINSKNASILANSPITFNGEGNLEIEGNVGIQGKNMKYTSGIYTIHSKETAIDGEEISVANGKLKIDSNGCGIQSKTFYTTKASYDIDAKEEGIYSSSTNIHSGYFTIHGLNGIVGEKELNIFNGTIQIDADKNGFVSSGSIFIEDGTMDVTCKEVGIDAKSIEKNGGTISVFGNVGLNGNMIDLNGGSTTIESQSQGIQASSILIRRGRTSIQSNTGIDCDTSIEMTGGTMYISASSIMKYKENATISGGSFVGTGMDSMNFKDVSVGCIQLKLDSTQSENSDVVLLDSKENPVEVVTSQKPYNTVMVCSAGISKSGKYTLYAGEEIHEIQIQEYRN